MHAFSAQHTIFFRFRFVSNPGTHPYAYILLMEEILHHLDKLPTSTGERRISGSHQQYLNRTISPKQNIFMVKL